MPLSEGCRGSKVLWSTISVEVGDGNPCNSKATGVIEVLETMEAPENGYIGIRACLPQTAVMNSPTEVHLHQCMDIKQEELEAIVQQENRDTIAIMETWWNDSHNWSAAVDCHKPFTRGGQGRRSVGVALDVGECFGCVFLMMVTVGWVFKSQRGQTTRL